MRYPLARFVDAVGSETVRLDLNDGTLIVSEETKGEAFGQPEWEAEPGDAGGEDGYRTTSLQIVCGKSKRTATRAYHRLALELQRPINYLLWQDSPKSEPRWIRVYRSQLPVLSYEYVGVEDDPDGGHDVWQATLELSSDAYAYGRPVTLHREILNLPDSKPRATNVGNYSPNPSIEVASRGWVGGEQRRVAQAVAGASVYGVTTDPLTVTNHLLNPSYESAVAPLTITNWIRDPLPMHLSSVQGAATLDLLEPGRVQVTTYGGGAAYIYAQGENVVSSNLMTVSCNPGDVLRACARWTALTAPIKVQVVFIYYDASGTLTGNGAYSELKRIPAGETRTVSSLVSNAPAKAASFLALFYLTDDAESEITPAGVRGVVGQFFSTVNEPLPAQYFDGSTPEINGTYEWHGDAYASASTGTIYPELMSWWAQPQDDVEMDSAYEHDWPGRLGRWSARLRRRSSAVADMHVTPTAAPVSGVVGATPVRARVSVGRTDTSAAAPVVTARLSATFISDDGSQSFTGDTVDVTAATTVEIDTTAPTRADTVTLSVDVHQEPVADTVNRIHNPTFGKAWSTDWWQALPGGETSLYWIDPGTVHVVAAGNDTTYIVPVRDDGSTFGTEYEPISAGQVARFRVTLSADEAAIGSFIRIWFYDSTKKSLGSSEIVRENEIAAGESRTLNLEAVAPDGAAYGIPRIYLTTATGSKPPVGLTMALHYVALTVDQLMPDDPFDGNTPDTDLVMYRWQGDPWGSPSLIVHSEIVYIDAASLALNEMLLPVPFDGSTEPTDGFTFAWTGDKNESPSTATGDSGLLWQWATDSLGDLWLSEVAIAQESVWTLSTWIGTTTSTAVIVTPSVVWLDDDGAQVASDDGETTTVLGSSTARVAVTSVKPAGAVRGRFTVDGRTAATGEPARPFLDAVMFEQGATATSYQDGDSAGWAWTGAAGLSTSGPIDPTTGRPAHAILSADDLLGDGPASVTLRLKPSVPWHVAEPLIQVTAFESPGIDVAPVVLNFGPEESSTASGFVHVRAVLWVDIDPRVTWSNVGSVRWIDL